MELVQDSSCTAVVKDKTTVEIRPPKTACHGGGLKQGTPLFLVLSQHAPATNLIVPEECSPLVGQAVRHAAAATAVAGEGYRLQKPAHTIARKHAKVMVGEGIG